MESIDLPSKENPYYVFLMSISMIRKFLSSLDVMEGSSLLGREGQNPSMRVLNYLSFVREWNDEDQRGFLEHIDNPFYVFSRNHGLVENKGIADESGKAYVGLTSYAINLLDFFKSISFLPNYKRYF